MSTQPTTIALTSPNGRSSRLGGRLRPRHRMLAALLLGALLTGAAVLLLPPAAGATPPAEPPCAQGTFCAWAGGDYREPVSEHSAQHVARERCVPLPRDHEVRSFANRTGHPVTVYQDPDCDTHAEFSTHANGSRAPHAPYVARAITVWEH